ncbi:MAG: peptidase MA family metallohydrolase [Phycisphaerae bacterium]
MAYRFLLAVPVRAVTAMVCLPFVIVVAIAGLTALGMTGARAGQPAMKQPREAVDGPSATIKLKTGGLLQVRIVDHDDEAVAVLWGETLLALAWNELAMPSAYQAFRKANYADTGENDSEAAMRVGEFCLRRNRLDLANRAFARAVRIDPSHQQRTVELVRQFRERRRNSAKLPGSRTKGQVATEEAKKPQDAVEIKGLSGLAALPPTAFGLTEGATLDDNGRRRAMNLYREFGESVRNKIYDDLFLMETRHFLIYTDWPAPFRDQLGEQCEAMFESLARRFGVSTDSSFFLAKCPVFCWSATSRFQRFARAYDGFDGRSSLGYTRSVAASGHVHMSLLTQGFTPDDLDRFAGTLVHEGTHAFLHRLESTRLIPHWVNEGMAEFVAEEVLGSRYEAAEKAELLAKQFVRFDWPITSMLARTGPIAVHEYPLAHSLIQFLASRGTGKLGDFIRHLKAGMPVAEALPATFDGLTMAQLEPAWRDWVRDRHDDLGGTVLPWKSKGP